MDNNWCASVVDSRQKITKRFQETLLRSMHDMRVTEDEVFKIASRYEEKIFQAATDQQDYLRKIARKILSFETKASTNPVQVRGTHGAQAAAQAATTGSQMQQVEQQWFPQQEHRSFLKIAKECVEEMEKIPSRNFNNDQCDYLVDKLKVVIQSASLFSEVLCAKDCQPCSSVDFARHVENFKFLLALANQVKSFVQGCCKAAWVQAAMTLANAADHVSSIGSNLELCRVAFCKECARTESLTLDQVVEIDNVEVAIVKEKASADVETLLARVKSELSSMRGGKRSLADYVLHRLSSVQANNGSLTSGSSFSAVHEESFWGRLFKWVKPAQRLGKGAAATVHKATWLGMQVAKKTFEGHENPDFLKEVGILGKLCHPNVTSMFCCAKDNRCCAIIMELMDEDLHDMMRRRCNGNSNCAWPFPILEAVDIMLQIGEGVNYLHSQKIVHRDLKSFNILVKTVKERGSKIEYVHAKVADFGLSKTKESSIRYSTQTFNTGTNRWMAPEIINLNMGEQEKTLGPKYPFKCDVYSFAMVCYEILTGYEPFYEERSLNKIKEKVVKGERPNLPDCCPPYLKALIEQCWIQDPEERPRFAFICSGLKYLKYLLMTGVDGIPPTSGLAKSGGSICASTSEDRRLMGQMLGQNSFSEGQPERQLEDQRNPQQMSVQQLNPEQVDVQQMILQQMSGQQLNPECVTYEIQTNECTRDEPPTDASTDLMEEVPQTSGECAAHTVESTPTSSIVPKMKDVRDQSVQDDETSFQEDVSYLGNQEDEFETPVASCSGNVTEREAEGKWEQESGGVSFDRMVTPTRRSREVWKAYSSEHGDEFQPRKRERKIMNERQSNAMEAARQSMPEMHRSPRAFQQW